MDYDVFLAFARSRRSIRRYADNRVPRSQIDRLIEAACWAPSNHNRQGWKFMVFDDPQEIRRLAEEVRDFVKRSVSNSPRLAPGQAEEVVHYAGGFDQAPVVILVMHKKSPSIGRSLLQTATSDLVSGEVLSAAMACQNLLLAAHAMGLGACVMTAPLLAGEVWASLKDLPLGLEPTCLVTVGHPFETPDAPRRKRLEHVMEYR